MAQTGIVTGKVTDLNTGEELVGATISVEGTVIGTITNFMGDFEMPPLEPGVYNIRCQYISYEPEVFANVKVNEDNPVVLDIKLRPAELDLGEVTVVAKANRESENLLLLEQKKAVMAKQSIGAQELSRKGVSDAEGAVTKMSGVNKQEGVKNVFVRGLGDRYNATMLNGFPVPSEDPEYKNISLDFFGSDVIQSIDVNKVFNSEGHGDVGGAIINVNSKELTGDGEFSIGGSLGGNMATIGNSFISPDGVNGVGYAKNPGSATSDSWGFNNKLNPSRNNFTLNQSFNFGGGASVNDKLNYYVIGNYDTDFFSNEGVVRSTATNGRIDEDFDYEKYIRSTSHMLGGNVNYQLNMDNSISFNTLYIHTNRAYYGTYEGYDAEIENRGGNVGDNAYTIRQQVNDNTLLVNQLYADLKLSSRLTFKPGVSVNYIAGNEPDRRINRMIVDQNDEMLRFMTSQTSQQRFFSALRETDANMRAEFEYSLKDDGISKLDFGYKGRITNREFEGDVYGMEVYNRGVAFHRNNIDLDSFFNATNQGVPRDPSSGDFYIDVYENEYSVSSYIHSGFVNGTYQLSPQLIVSGGVRIDMVDFLVDYHTVEAGVGSASINELYVLPSINSKYSFSDKNSLRLGLSKTYTMPQAKEVAPFEYTGETFRSQGNPNLQPSQNYNVDLKYDFYLSNDEIFSVGGFYKHIIDPISRIEELSAAGFLTYRNIADYATAAGLEVEIRKNIYKYQSDHVSKKLALGINGSYIYTHAELGRDDENIPFTNSSSQLEGAAPLIINTDLTYSYKKGASAFTAAMVYNYTSDKLYTVGTSGFEDTNETAVGTLDFIATAKLNKHWGLNIKAQNLLNPEYKITREPYSGGEPVTLMSFRKGEAISIGVSYTF